MNGLVPGEALDLLFAERAEGYVWDETRCRVCGWKLGVGIEAICTKENCSMRPRPERRADEVAPVSTDNGVALAALERFCDKRKAWWEMQRTPGRYAVRLIGSDMPIEAQTAKTLAHAIVLCLLKAVEEVPDAE